MNNFKITSFLTSNLNINPEEILKLISNFNIVHYKKGTNIIAPGQICTHIYFVEKGLLRQFSIDTKGKEHNVSFAPENWLITDRSSLYYKENSPYYIQALEDTDVIILEPDFFELINNHDPKFKDFNNGLLNKHIKQLQHRINSLLSYSAEERYLDFVKTYPDLNLRIPQTMIASYLGITPESLSRVRRELALKYKQNRT